MKIDGIILAGGEGTRAHPGHPKQFWALQKETGKRGADIIEDAMQDAGVIGKVIKVGPKGIGDIEGGPTRIESLYNGVQASDADYVIFTDACRVYTPSWVFAYIAGVLDGRNAIAVVQDETDSILIEQLGHVSPGDRDTIYRIQTPNGFNRQVLLEVLDHMIENNITGPAISHYMIKFSDKYGVPTFFTTPFFNDKITTASDLEHAVEYFSKGTC